MPFTEHLHQRGRHVQSAHGRRLHLATDGSHLNGAMVALMPTAADATRLALKGGEAAADLHVTLSYLGQGADWDADAQAAVVDSLRAWIGELPAFTARIFGIAHWNGDGDEPSWVWSVGDEREADGPGLSKFHAVAVTALEDAATSGENTLPALPAQHTPWVPHICAAYTADLSLARELEKRLGTVTFDRVRVAFAGEHTDIPLAEAVTAAAGPLRRNPYPHELACKVDFASAQHDWQTAVDAAVGELQAQMVRWRSQIRAQIIEALLTDDPEALLILDVDTSEATALLEKRLTATAERAGRAMQREAEQQGVDVPEWHLPDDADAVTAALGGRRLLASVAQMTSNLMASSLVQSAKQRVTSLLTSVSAPEVVAGEVDRELAALSEARPREAVGAAVSAAQTEGRKAVLDVAPPAQSYYASEILDKSTCKPCRKVDGQTFPDLKAATAAYPIMGYKDCQGRSRCRGMIVARWTLEPEAATTASAVTKETPMPWHVEHGHSECEAGKPWAVVKDADGSVEGCHASEAEAEDHLAALYANEPEEAMATTDALGGKPNEGTKKDKRLKENKGGKAAAETTDLAAPVIAAEAPTAPWEGPLTVEGTETGDGREFDAGALTWADLPLPLRWNIEDSHGGEPHTVAVNVGRIDEIWRDGSLIMGRGVLDLSDEHGVKARDKIEGKYLRGVSVDVDSIKEADMEMVWPEPPEGEDVGEADIFDMLFASPDKVIFHAGRIRAATLVDIPAFAEAYIALLGDDGAVVAGGEPVGADHRQREKTGRMHSLVASAALDKPPLEWFTNPGLTVPTPITITEAGRIYGHAALWGTCHIGQAGVCVTPPREDYHDHYLTGEVICADGTAVSVGQITVGTNHAPLTYDSRAASDHYDNTGAAVADVMVGNDDHGIWVAGAVKPGADETRVRALRAAGQVSGDWRRIGGHLRLVGLLAVNVPGFPVPKLRTRVKADVQLALVAAGVPDLRDEQDQRAVEKLAMQVVMDMYRRRVHGAAAPEGGE